MFYHSIAVDLGKLLISLEKGDYLLIVQNELKLAMDREVQGRRISEVGGGHANRGRRSVLRLDHPRRDARQDPVHQPHRRPQRGAAQLYLRQCSEQPRLLQTLRLRQGLRRAAGRPLPPVRHLPAEIVWQIN